MENDQDGLLCKRAVEAKQCGGYQPKPDKKPCNPPKSRDGLHKMFEGNKARGVIYTIPNTINKREMIAAMAMQGILSSLTNEREVPTPYELARSAVRNADALLAELEKPV